MLELRIGVMGCANIAFKAMVPAMHQAKGVQLVALSSRSAEKARHFTKSLGGEAVVGYQALLERDDIDAIYMPLPTGLHKEWIERTLAAGKHLLVEKSFAPDAAIARYLLDLARDKQLCVLENYLFPHHSQTRAIHEIVNSGELGELRLLRTTFSFPPLPKDNFRYDAALGGGALLDAGGYVLQAAQEFLAGTLTLAAASLEIDRESKVDIAGSATLVNTDRISAQCYFGFHSYYQCLLELLGTEGKLTTGRIFTSPPGFRPTINLQWQGRTEERILSADNHYQNMWEHFALVVGSGQFDESYQAIQQQADFQQRIREMSDA